MVASVTTMAKHNHILGILVASPGIGAVMNLKPLLAVTELAAMLGASQGIAAHLLPVRTQQIFGVIEQLDLSDFNVKGLISTERSKKRR